LHPPVPADIIPAEAQVLRDAGAAGPRRRRAMGRGRGARQRIEGPARGQGERQS